MPTVREFPPTRLSVNVQPPSGQSYRWAADEPKAADVPNGLSFSTSAPGGFESCSLTLPRRPRLSYPDLELMSNVTVSGAGAQIAWEGRIEGVPRVSGNEAAVSPEIVGWQAHLEDDTSASMVYVDRDLGNWREPSRSRQVALSSSIPAIGSASVLADHTNVIPAMHLEVTGAWTTRVPCAEIWYDGGAGLVASVYDDFSGSSDTNSNFILDWHSGTTDAAFVEDSADLFTATTGSGTRTPSTPRRFFGYNWRYNTSGGGDNFEFSVDLRYLTVWGAHGLTKRGTAPSDGLYASDVVAHALGYAPRIRYTTGFGGSITASSFIIPQLAFLDPTTASEIISAANRYHLRDWFVWEGTTAGQPTFYYHPRGERGRAWRARVGPSQLAETGTAIERAWNGVIVRYNDVDGTPKTVGPTGADTDATSADLLDTDPLNPLNRAGIRRWQTIDMSGVSTVAGATELGRRFLVEARAYDTSGQAQIVGHCEDDRGVMRPAWQVRAGDTITFVDAADTSARRVIKTNYSDDSKTNAIDLDAPPDALAALLERLQVELVPFGL